MSDFYGDMFGSSRAGGGGGFTPTSDQLEAMNSGITAADVEQINTNKNNISLVNGEQTFSDMMFAESTISQYVSTDVDGQKIATFRGTSGTTFWYQYSGTIAPKKVILFEFWAKTSEANTGATSLGTGLDIRFFDKNDTQIGGKYTMEVLYTDRYGYNKYQHISPAGTDHYIVRVFTRGATTGYIKRINVNVLDNMPMVSGNTVNYDCHLGAIKYAPKNTFAAYEMGKQLGFKNLIVNIKRTSDNKLVCIHNTTIDSTSDGTGEVSSFTYEQLLQYDFGSWFSPYYTGEKIPLFEDVLKFVIKSNMELIVSIHDSNTNTDIDDMYTLIAKYSLLGKCILKFTSTAQVEYAYSVFGDGAKYVYAYGGILDSTTKTWIQTFGHLDYIETGYNRISHSYVADCHDLGIEVIGTTVDFIPYVGLGISNGVCRFTSDMCSDLVC